jgi:hypothetical protein
MHTGKSATAFWAAPRHASLQIVVGVNESASQGCSLEYVPFFFCKQFQHSLVCQESQVSLELPVT